MSSNKNSELREIKSKLVNVSLIVASIIGLPMLFAAIERSMMIKLPHSIFIEVFIYFIVLLATILRKKLPYSIRAVSILILIFSLALNDFLNTGFQSAGYLWLCSGVIIAALYFDLKRSFIVLACSLIMIVTIALLHSKGIITYHIDLNTYLFLPITIIMKTLDLILLGSMTAITIHYIQKKLSSNINLLQQKKDDLEKIKAKLEMEIEIRRSSEQLALNSEKNFRNIFDKSSDAILIIGDDRSVLDFNEAYVQMSGFKENEIFSMQYNQLLPEDDHQKYEHFYNNIDTFPGKLEFSIETPTQGQKFFDCSTSIINFSGQKSILFMIRDYTERKSLEKRNYLTTIEAEEKERLRFSKELHDGLGPLLSTLKIYLEVFFVNPDDAEIRERIENTLTESIKSVKEISNNLSPYILENMGLVKAVNSFVEKIKFGKMFDIDFQSNLNFRLKPEIEISVYRFITELINNTIKHANASKIHINIEEINKKLEIRYSDNGIGFNIDAVSLSSNGIGLFNLRSRIEKLGGRIEMRSSPGSGFSILATLKIE